MVLLVAVLAFFFITREKESDLLVEQVPILIKGSKLAEITKRFEKSYPPSKEKHDISDVRELNTRLMILKNMPTKYQNVSMEEKKALQSFYLKIIERENEPWPARVQALRNLRKMKNLGTPKEREQILSRIDKRILHLAQYTEEELLEQVIEHEINN